jgi:uncharacterized metal-binding protein
MRPNTKLQKCICSKQGCWRGKDTGIPAYCFGNDYVEEIQNATTEYKKPGVVSLYKAASVVGEHSGGMTPRIKEALLFAKELKLKKIGFAACSAMQMEMNYLQKLFEDEGFEVIIVSCQIGRVSATTREVPEVQHCYRSSCNPIAQAKILNSEDTEINFLVGLCMGHDVIFTKYSEAPVSTLIVKDRVTGNNPAAALYGWHRRKQLFGMQLSDDRLV